MSSVALRIETTNPETGLTHSEMQEFVRTHFEEFMNRRNMGIGDVNFAPEFIDHGADLPAGTPPGPASPKAHMSGMYSKFPDIHVTIEDLIAEGDKVVVRNTWTATDQQTGTKLQMSGIVIWRIAHRQLVERWAYTEKPRPTA